MLLSIVIPAYNEENRILPTLETYQKYFSQNYTGNYEIIVVLNGCKDKTLQIVQRFSEQNPKNIKHLNFGEAIGKGGAIKEGFVLATGTLIGYTDADGSTRPEILDRLIKILGAIPTIECVLGSRNIPGSVIKDKTFSREILSFGFNFLVNFLFNLKVRDTQCGAKIARKEIVKKIIPTLSISNMAFDINFLVDIKKNGGDILEIPIEWEDNLDSKIKNKFKTSLGMALSVLRLRFLYSPLKIFYPFLKPLSDFTHKFLK
jgi:dolichol-phosphate mannosyltransferase